MPKTGETAEMRQKRFDAQQEPGPWTIRGIARDGGSTEKTSTFGIPGVYTKSKLGLSHHREEPSRNVIETRIQQKEEKAKLQARVIRGG